VVIVSWLRAQMGEQMPSASIPSSVHKGRRSLTGNWRNIDASALVLAALLNQ